MFVEAWIFTGNGGILHELADRFRCNLDAVLVVERCQEYGGAIVLSGINIALLRQLLNRQVVGQVIEDTDGIRCGHARKSERRSNSGGHEHTGNGAHADEAEKAAEGSAHRSIFGRHTLESKGQS